MTADLETDALTHLMRQEPPDVLWHYTSAAGLLGIIERNGLWLTDYRYLNDPTEVETGKQIIEQEVRARWDDPDINRPPRFAGSLYLASFSENGDDLSQWRSYGCGGRGFAIGFNTERLRDGLTWRRVSYDAGEFRTQVRSVLQSLKLEIDKFTFGHARETVVSHTYARLLRLVPFACHLKHGGFKSEAEWRLASWVYQTPKVRVAGERLVPFSVLDLPDDKSRKSCIGEIRLGPLQEEDIGRHVVKQAWNFHRPHQMYMCPSIKKSKIPYRP